MNVETKLTLSDTAISKLRDLIRINVDSYNGFAEAAESINNESIADLFREFARQRAEFASSLKRIVSLNDEEPRVEGSLSAAIHRLWIDVRSMLSGGDAHAILSEAERGEDQIKAAYEEALKETAGSAANDILTEQYAAIKEGHDRIRGLRDAYADTI